MKPSEWEKLPEQEQLDRCQQLNPYEEWDIFKAVEKSFMAAYGEQPAVGKVFCGIGGSVGPINAIGVTIKKGQPRSKLPEYFLGFPVLKTYESASK